METLAMPAINFAAIMPETILSIVAMALLLVNVFVPTEQKAYLGYLSLIGIVVAFVPTVTGWNAPAELQNGFNGSVLQDNFALFFKGIFLVSAALSILISDQYMGYLPRPGGALRFPLRAGRVQPGQHEVQ